MATTWHTATLREGFDVLAPDGSEIRVLVQVNGGSMVHCTLRPGVVTQPVQHRTVEEVWFFLRGEGEVWRSGDGHEEITAVRSGVALTIPLGTHFQFRATGSEPLEFVITTIPPWPGPDEAIPVPGAWAV
jgi:mannose-6-phosphate isomerase-like protein (cupin superfamily)